MCYTFLKCVTPKCIYLANEALNETTSSLNLVTLIKGNNEQI